MPKTIAIAPSHYWPRGVTRTFGIPPFPLHELILDSWARLDPNTLAISDGHQSISALALKRIVSSIAKAIDDRVPTERVLAVSLDSNHKAILSVLGALASQRPFLLFPSTQEAISQLGNFQVDLLLVDNPQATYLSGTSIELISLDDLVDLQNCEQLSSAMSPDDLVDLQNCEQLSSAMISAKTAASRVPKVGIFKDGKIAWHSNRSLTSHCLSMTSFITDNEIRPVISTFSPSSWQGLMVLSATLLSGRTLFALAPSEVSLDSIRTLDAGWLYINTSDAASTFDLSAKRSKGDRYGLNCVLVDVSDSFEPGTIRSITKILQCPTLSFYGMPETGPIIGSHPSWYLAESVGLPLPNVHIIPTDPRTKAPIATLWELIDSAMISIWSPSVMLGYHGDELSYDGFARLYSTGKLAASDPNGMLYLVDE